MESTSLLGGQRNVKSTLTMSGAQTNQSSTFQEGLSSMYLVDMLQFSKLNAAGKILTFRVNIGFHCMQ